MKAVQAPRILVISSFPPMRCGIGSYAAQQVFALRREGAVVQTVCLASEGMGTYPLRLFSMRSIVHLMLALLPVRFDKIYFHYVDEFVPHNPTPFRERLMLALQCALFVYFRIKARTGLHIVVHELIPRSYRGRGFDRLRRFIFGVATALEFHTSIERDAANQFLNFGDKGEVVPHGRYFARRFHGSKADARTRLNLPADAPIFLCIGFLQSHKAFDHAVKAFEDAKVAHAHLYVVGSVRIPDQAVLRYRRTLARQIKATPGAHLIDSYVDDEDFDAWLCACDMLIVPYKEIWTSGVLARAGLYGRKVAMRHHATLVEQAGKQRVVTFETNDELSHIMSSFQVDAADVSTPSKSAARRRANVLVVAPLFGSLVRGGAEQVIGRFCAMLSDHYNVEVWATGSSRLEPRNNVLLEDSCPQSASLTVRRFPTNIGDEARFKRAHAHIAQGDGRIRWRAQWCNSAISGIGMDAALRAEHERFDAILLPHYFYGSTHRLAPIAPEKTLLHPFIHDEPALRTRAIADVFAAPSLVLLNSDAELVAARRARTTPVFDARVIGNVVEAPDWADDSQVEQDYQEVRRAIGADKFILYLGRVTAMKNVDDLISWHREAGWQWDEPVKLVLLGEGDLEVAEDDDIVRLGQVSEGVKWRLLQECLALAQLSVLESFSLVIMEAWLAGRPVIVNAACDATSLHVARSKGGFAVASPALFNEAVCTLLANPDQANALGAAGRAYVLREYSDERVRARLVAAVEEVTCRQVHVAPTATTAKAGRPILPDLAA